MKLNSAQKRQTEMLAAPVSMRDHIQGTFDAPVTLLEYGDYECTASATVCAVIKAIQDIMRDQLRFVFRNFPLPNVHPHVERAAQAAESAACKAVFGRCTISCLKIKMRSTMKLSSNMLPI